MNCIRCNEITQNSKFCSKSCAATYNNRKYPKRKLSKSCKSCDTKIPYNRKFCDVCLCVSKYRCAKHMVFKKLYKSGKRKCIKCNSEYQSENRRNKILKLKKMAGGQCQICNYSKSTYGLHFHHLDPTEKEFNIGHGNNRSFKRMQNEAAKCILLCANCHAEVHENITVVTGIGPAISSLTN